MFISEGGEGQATLELCQILLFFCFATMLPASTAIVPPCPTDLLEEGSILYQWAVRRSANPRQANHIVGLLDLRWMCKLPCPPRTWRRPGVEDYVWHRYLFRRHIQHILGWTQRREESDLTGFAELNKLIRESLFPDPSGFTHGPSKRRIEGDGAGQSSGAITGAAQATTETDISTSSQCNTRNTLWTISVPDPVRRGGNECNTKSDISGARPIPTPEFGESCVGIRGLASTGKPRRSTCAASPILHLGADQPYERSTKPIICATVGEPTSIDISIVTGAPKFSVESPIPELRSPGCRPRATKRRKSDAEESPSGDASGLH